MGYAKIDPDFREKVEEAVPGADSLLNMVLGEPEAPQKSLPTPPKKSLPKPSVTSTPPSKKRPPVAAVEDTPKQQVEATDEVTDVKVAAPAERPKPEQEPDDSLVIVSGPPLDKPTFLKDPAPDNQQASTAVVVPTLETQDPSEEIQAKEVTKVLEDKATKIAGKEEQPTKKTETLEMKVSRRTVTDDLDLDNRESIMQEKDLHRKIQMVRNELEAEMVAQLRRQAEAHADHLSDAMDVQRQELERLHLRQVDEAHESAEQRVHDEMARMWNLLQGLQDRLKGRAHMDRAAVRAQELWLACAALEFAVARGTSDLEVRSLVQEVGAVTTAANGPRSDHHDAFVATIIDSIPAEAINRGIYTEDSIRNRFQAVAKAAKRTAFVDHPNASLFKYALSYLQSLLVVEPLMEELPLKHEAIDVNSLNTFDLVWLARGSLERGDLDQAVRYMTLLKGQPANVASDWLKEARLLLETKQAVQALRSHAAAVGVEALPQSND